MKLKVCGMHWNTLEVAALNPEYLGFIFWAPSQRFFKGTIPELPTSVKKVGVFVDAPIEEIIEKINIHDLQAVQLHGNESPDFCQKLTYLISNPTKEGIADKLEIIKVFSIKDTFNFNILTPYEAVCNYYLFDSKGELPGGNGYTFSWQVLENYPSTKPYFLSGGIGLSALEKIKEFQEKSASKYCYAIDVNSKFELKPGCKDINKLNRFITSVREK